MPTYEYHCKKCGFVLEEFQSITAPPLVHCPNCNTDSLVRGVGGGAGVIFKGSGFYQTDYKKSNSPGTSKPRKGAPGSTGGASDATAETKKEKPEKKESPGPGAGPAGPKKE